MSKELAIRLATLSDMPEVAGVFVASYTDADIGEVWTEKAAQKLLEHFYHLQPDLFFVAKKDGKIVGAIVALVKPWWDGNHLTDGELFVDPDYQKKGMGTVLIHHLFKQARLSYDAVAWDTFTHKIYKHPLAWYRKMGFEEVRQWVMISGDIQAVLKNIS